MMVREPPSLSVCARPEVGDRAARSIDSRRQFRCKLSFLWAQPACGGPFEGQRDAWAVHKT